MTSRVRSAGEVIGDGIGPAPALQVGEDAVATLAAAAPRAASGRSPHSACPPPDRVASCDPAQTFPAAELRAGLETAACCAVSSNALGAPARPARRVARCKPQLHSAAAGSGSTRNQCSMTASAMSVGEQRAVPRPRTASPRRRSRSGSSSAATTVDHRDRERKQQVHRPAAEVALQVVEMRRQELLGEIRHAEEDVELGAEPREPEDEEGPDADLVGRAPRQRHARDGGRRRIASS